MLFSLWWSGGKIAFHPLPLKLDGTKLRVKWWYGMKLISSYSISFYCWLYNSFVECRFRYKDDLEDLSEYSKSQTNQPPLALMPVSMQRRLRRLEWVLKVSNQPTTIGFNYNSNNATLIYFFPSRLIPFHSINPNIA
jgi:hypothetical protein